jgi:hypothetical protein
VALRGVSAFYRFPCIESYACRSAFSLKVPRRACVVSPRVCLLLATDKAETVAQSSLETAENVNSDSRSGVGSFGEPQVSGPQEIDWRRLKGYKAACSIKKTPSWIWQHSCQLWNEDELEFWLCKRCHHGPVKRPFPKGHISQTTRATSTAALHMTKQHSINENGTVTPSRPLSKKRKLEDCNFDANTVQHRTVSSFDPNQFRALLLEWIIADSIPFQKIESDHFRRLLAFIGCNLHLEDHLISHTTLS